jgi:hypothetical protein
MHVAVVRCTAAVSADRRESISRGFALSAEKWPHLLFFAFRVGQTCLYLRIGLRLWLDTPQPARGIWHLS